MVYVRRLLAGLRERGHEVEIVSHLNVRNLWRGRVAAHRIVTEAISVRKAMKRFTPDAWLVYVAAVQNPDLFGWWQHPKRYVLINTNTGRGDRLPRRWHRLFWFAHRRSLARADAIAAERPTHADDLRSFGIAEERLSVFPPVLKAWDWMPSREESRRRLGLPQEAAVILCVSRLSEEK